MGQYILAIDQGTTSTRAMVFTRAGAVRGVFQQPFQQYFPQDGWVEHDGEEIWQTVLACCKGAVEKANLTVKDIAAIGISNQRETTLLWDKTTGELLAPAIVWQDRRTTDFCHELKAQSGIETMLMEKPVCC